MCDLGHRYSVETKATDHYDYSFGRPDYPYKTTYRWGVYDNTQRRFTKIYRVPFIGRLLATRLCDTLNAHTERLRKATR